MHSRISDMSPVHVWACGGRVNRCRKGPNKEEGKKEGKKRRFKFSFLLFQMQLNTQLLGFAEFPT